MRNRAIRTFFRSKTGVLGACLVFLFLLAALLAPVLAPFDPEHQIDGKESQSPSSHHWLGTTPLGEDMASRILHGARTSLKVGVISVAISCLAGLFLGVIAGYRGGWVDTLIMRAIDILMAFPSILLAITIVSILGRSLHSIMIAVGVVGIPVFARQVRASVLAVRELEYVTASRALGAHASRIVLRHILPATMGPVIVLTSLRIATAILESAGLSFLGLGGEAILEWGTMLAENKDHYARLPHLVLAPGIAISLTVLAFNLFGDALRDALDPRLHR
ncbi:MAG: ABC transporter permease [Planctomycetota bacterium]|jgi:peptide/nickel transport system permease protein|nr:ABC transporter permease [Planctomycetota bacterium]